VVEVFFHLASKWSKWCAQTLHPFSQILKISSRTNRSAATIFKFVLSVGKCFSFPKKTLQTPCESAYKHRRYLAPERYLQKSQKTSHFILSRRHASIDFDHILHDDRGPPCHHCTIITSSKIWLKTPPPRLIIYNFVIYRDKAAKFGRIM